MNGISYGRFDGLASNTLRRGQQQQKQFAADFHSKPQQFHFGTEWQREHINGISPNNHIGDEIYGTERSRVSDRHQTHQLISANDGTIRRPYSAESYATATDHRPKMFRSYDGIGTNRPLTKQVDQLLYDIPQNRFSKNALCQPPEFLKVFSDVRCAEGQKAVFDCVLLGTPRPRVCWLFNDEKMDFGDVILEDTADICRCTINSVRPQHYGIYMVLAENEVGRAITTATLLPVVYNQF